MRGGDNERWGEGEMRVGGGGNERVGEEPMRGEGAMRGGGRGK